MTHKRGAIRRLAAGCHLDASHLELDLAGRRVRQNGSMLYGDIHPGEQLEASKHGLIRATHVASEHHAVEAVEALRAIGVNVGVSQAARLVTDAVS